MGCQSIDVRCVQVRPVDRHREMTLSLIAASIVILAWNLTKKAMLIRLNVGLSDLLFRVNCHIPFERRANRASHRPIISLPENDGFHRVGSD
jgi:hypothetical protein